MKVRVAVGIIELHPDIRGLTKEAKRIADALEIIVLHEYKVRLSGPSKAELKGDEPEVTYSTDFDTLKNELLEEVGRLPRRPEMGDGPDQLPPTNPELT